MAVSNTSMESSKFTWRINCFNMCAQLFDEPICCPKFSLNYFDDTIFCLYLYPRGRSNITKEFMSIYIGLHECADRPNVEYVMAMELKLYLDCVEKDPVYTDTKLLEVSKKDGNNLLQILCMKRSSILKDSEPFRLVKIKLVLDITALSANPLNSSRKWKCKNSDLEKLSCDLLKALETPIYHDLTLKCNSGVHFGVHKCILISRYPKLAETLGLNDTRTGEYHLCVDPVALKSLITYLYSGKINVENMPHGIHSILRSDDLPHLRHTLYPFPKEFTASTTIRFRHGCFIWNIPNLDKHSHNLILKQSLSCDNMLDWTKLCVTCSFEKDENNEEYMTFAIHRIFWENSMYIACNIRIIDTNYMKEYGHLFIKGTEWKISQFISKNTLIRVQEKIIRKNRSPLIKSGCLKISFHFYISDGNFMSEIVSVRCPDVSKDSHMPLAKNLLEVHRDLKYLCESSVCSDVILCVGEEELQAHRIVLSLRSSVFSEMFEQKANEEGLSKIVIENFKPDVVKAMISYIYCGEVDNVPQGINFVIELYAIDDKYALPQLRKKCVFHLNYKLDSENAGKILVLAHSHTDDYLKKIVKKYVCDNPKEILNSSGWKAVMNDRMDLAADILSGVLSHIGKK